MKVRNNVIILELGKDSYNNLMAEGKNRIRWIVCNIEKSKHFTLF